MRPLKATKIENVIYIGGRWKLLQQDLLRNHCPCVLSSWGTDRSHSRNVPKHSNDAILSPDRLGRLQHQHWRRHSAYPARNVPGKWCFISGLARPLYSARKDLQTKRKRSTNTISNNSLYHGHHGGTLPG